MDGRFPCCVNLPVTLAKFWMIGMDYTIAEHWTQSNNRLLETILLTLACRAWGKRMKSWVMKIYVNRHDTIWASLLLPIEITKLEIKPTSSVAGWEFGCDLRPVRFWRRRKKVHGISLFRMCYRNVRIYAYKIHCRHGIKENILPKKCSQSLSKLSKIYEQGYFLTRTSYSRSFLHAAVMLFVTAVECGEQNSHMKDMNTCLTREYMLEWNSMWPHAWKSPFFEEEKAI
jgi:hypothetical protein